MDLNVILIFSAAVMIAAIFGSRISSRSGIPVLLVFMFLGILAGTDGILGIDFEDYDITNNICSAALIFIMFYGGFGTNWNAARSVAVPSVLLASLGVVITALLTGVFGHIVLRLEWLDALLLGSVLASTDAASVFSILRSHRLSLKYGTSSLLEMESGSNDPAAYLLVMIFLGLRQGETAGAVSIIYEIFSQIAYALLTGVTIAFLAKKILDRFHFPDGFASIFILAVAVLSYALPSMVGGNGYLSAYLAGILMGNMKIEGKRDLVAFLNAFNAMMQIVIFFLLGLLATPSSMIAEIGIGLPVALFLLLIARPVAVAAVMTPFKAPLNQQLVICLSGIRGASSIVFSIVVTVAGGYHAGSVFNAVFIVVLLSIMLQGTLLPAFSKKVNMIDAEGDVMKTFNDFDDSSIEFIPFRLDSTSKWTDMRIRDIDVPPNSIIAAIDRDGEAVIPNGGTVLHAGDNLILGISKHEIKSSVTLSEESIGPGHPWAGKKLRDIGTHDTLILMIIRSGKSIIPSGDSVIMPGDIIVKNEKNR